MKFGVVIAQMLALSAFAADPFIVEQIIAKVNGEIITRTDMDRSKRLMDEEVKRRAAKEPEIVAQATERQKDILREKIDQMLLVQKGKELAINVDTEVSKWMADMQRRVKIADPEKFQQAIREETGQSFEDYRSELKNSILTRRVIGQEVASKVNIPKADVRKYYDEHKSEFQREERVFLREILISTEGKDDNISETPSFSSTFFFSPKKSDNSIFEPSSFNFGPLSSENNFRALNFFVFLATFTDFSQICTNFRSFVTSSCACTLNSCSLF